MLEFFKVVFFIPLYNTLIWLVDLAPGGDVGIAIILLTILVRFVLLPLSLKAARTQRIVKKIEPQVEEIKKKFKDNAEEQMKRIMALYKAHGFNPFVNFLFILVQLPIIFSLYFVFFKGGLPEIQTDLLYSFTPIPDQISVLFLNFLDMTGKSIGLALLAGVTQFFLFRLTFPKPKPLSDKPSFKEEMMRNMALQMRYVFPVIVTVIAYTISAAIALYWTVSNLFSILQEFYVRHRLDREEKRAQDSPNDASGSPKSADAR